MIRTFLIIEWVSLAILLLLAITQVVVPLFRRRPIFPMFRRKAVKAEQKQAKKLEAYLKVSEVYANAIKGSHWVPQFQFSGAGGNGAGSPADLINLLTAKTAKDLSLDLGVKK